MFCIFLGKSNFMHIKHLQCRSTEEIWNLYRITFLPSIMHCIVKTLWGRCGTVKILLAVTHIICVQHLELYNQV